MNAPSTLPLRAIVRARRTVAQSHPLFRHTVPSVSRRANGFYTLTFRTSISLPDGATMQPILRATVNEQGEVMRMMTSRG